MGIEEENLQLEIQKKVSEELKNTLGKYRQTLQYMAGNAPIEVLCLDPIIEKILLSSGFLRVYDLFERDLTEIKGIGKTRLGNITARLDEFISIG